MPKTSKTLPLLALLACLLCAAESRADTFYITGGSATSGNIIGGTFSVTGSGFALNGGFNYGPNSCIPCTAGQTANVGSFNLGLDVRGATAPSTFEGITYEKLYYSAGFVRFSASLVVPDETAAVFTVTTPFSFTAMLQGCTDPNGAINSCKPGDIVFDATFVGQGIATIEMGSIEDANGGRLYSIRSIRYDFAAATPEPATIALLASGLAGVGAFARRRRRK